MHTGKYHLVYLGNLKIQNSAYHDTEWQKNLAGENKKNILKAKLGEEGQRLM